MLGHTSQLLYQHPGGHRTYWIDRTVYFALLESALTHARALMDFLYPENPRSTDIIASDFMATDWTPMPRWESFKGDWDRICFEIMHLSFKRPDTTRGWDYGTIVEHLNERLRDFIRDVPAEHVTPDFKGLASDALANPFGGWFSVPTQTFRTATRLQERR